MALIWRITPLKSQLSVSSIRCTTLVQMSSPIRTLWIYIDVTISAEQAMLYLVYVERWLLWVTKLSWFKLGRLLQCCTWISEPLIAIASSRTEHNFVLEILKYSALQYLLGSYLNYLNMHSRLSDIVTWAMLVNTA